MVQYVDLPDILFVAENAGDIERNVIAVYEGLTELTLKPTDPVRLLLSSLTTIIVQQRILLNQTAKGNLLKYASGVLLDHKGASFGVERPGASFSITSLQFTLSIPLPSVTPIPTGTRIGVQGGAGAIYFMTTEYLEIPAGSTTGVITGYCSVAGTVGNDFLPGQINVLMDPLPFVQSVTNLTTSSGGAAEMSDDAFKEQIRTAPESYSTAGPGGAYEFWAKSTSAAILDVHAYKSNDSEVTIVPLLVGGQIPGQDIMDAIAEKLDDRRVRPLTDKVIVSAPTIVPYDTEVIYYISRSQAAEATSIQAAVSPAVTSYQLWQKSKLGRDINPSELIARVMRAGALRLNVISPIHTALTATQVAQQGETKLTYGGLVDD